MVSKIKITVVTRKGKVTGIFTNNPDRLELTIVDVDNPKPDDTIPETELIKFDTEKKAKQ